MSSVTAAVVVQRPVHKFRVDNLVSFTNSKMQFNMGFRIACLVVVAIAVMSIHESEAAPELGLIKAKLALKKVPHVLAKVAVAKEVKTKVKIAAAASLAAVSAHRLYAHISMACRFYFTIF